MGLQHCHESCALVGPPVFVLPQRPYSNVMGLVARCTAVNPQDLRSAHLQASFQCNSCQVTQDAAQGRGASAAAGRAEFWAEARCRCPEHIKHTCASSLRHMLRQRWSTCA